jgi:hypothetical protein
MNRWKTAALVLLGKGSRPLSLRDPDGIGVSVVRIDGFGEPP